jgi:hypothetical protein
LPEHLAGLRRSLASQLSLDPSTPKQFPRALDRLSAACNLLPYPFGQKTHLTAFSGGLLMIITQEPAQSLAAVDAPLTIELPVPRK